MRCSLAQRSRTFFDEPALPEDAQSGTRGSAPDDPRDRGLRRTIPLSELDGPGERSLFDAPPRLRPRSVARQTQTACATRDATLRGETGGEAPTPGPRVCAQPEHHGTSGSL